MCECMFSCIYAHAHIRLQSRIRSSRICVKYLTSFVAFTFSNVIWFSLCTSKGIWSWENHWRYVTERSDNEGWSGDLYCPRQRSYLCERHWRRVQCMRTLLSFVLLTYSTDNNSWVERGPNLTLKKCLLDIYIFHWFYFLWRPPFSPTNIFRSQSLPDLILKTWLRQPQWRRERLA